MAEMLQKTVFTLPGCQRMSANTLLCDTLTLADAFAERQRFTIGDVANLSMKPCIESHDVS